MDLNLTNSRVLVTGASKGIGLAVAKGFAAEGCDVDLVARHRDELNAVAKGIEKDFNVRATTHALDLSRSEAVAQLLDAAADVDILVNNAGAIPGGSLTDVDEDTWRAAWDLKVFGYINLTRAYFQIMCERKHGVIVNVIGLAGEKFDAGYIAGTTGNASLMAFTRGVGSRSIDDGVRVLGVNPGAVETGRIRTLMTSRAEKEYGDGARWRDYFKNLPLGRPAAPEEVADVVVFLASKKASYLSGIVVPIDGGHGSRVTSF